MPAINYNFIIEQGSDFEINFQYNDQNGTGIDLTNKCAVLQMRPSQSSTYYTFSSRSPATYANDDWAMVANDKGLINLKISAAITQTFSFDSAIYDLDILSETGDHTKNVRLTTGTVTIQKRNISLLNAFPTNISPSGTITTTNGSSGTTTTPTTSGSTSTSTPPDPIDFCLPTDCLNVDIYSVIYNGSGININELSSSSGSVNVNDNRIIENVELVINRLQHPSPQDLQLLLAPPSGNKILLAANQKIPNSTGVFSFMFSNKAAPTSYLHNISDGGLCNIYNKTNIVNYSNETLLSGFSHLFGSSQTGLWNLYIKDTDPLSSGLIGSWKLVVTYLPS
jgi:subtilisin-like proprotein convertase family protein